jgi:predicted dehydrogenase
MNKNLRFALIGCGKIAPRHAAEMIKHGTLVAVCDIEKEKADQFAGKFHTKAYYDVIELFGKEKQIDLVAICTPNGLHTEHSILALDHGMNVLCEKPLCISSGDAKKMMEAAERNDRNLFVVKSTRYNPSLEALKKIILEKKLGELYSFQLNCFWNRPETYYSDKWRGTLTLDGGTLYTQFSHYIDAMLWLFGKVKDIKGIRKNIAHKKSIEFEDSGIVAAEMMNGIIGGINWSVNAYQKNMEVSLSVLAEKGSIRIAGEYMNQVEYQLCGDIQIEIPSVGNANDYGFYKGSMSNHDKVYENMLRALNDPSHPFTNAMDGYHTVELIEKIYNTVPLS